MGQIGYCPIVGGMCNKEEFEIKTKPNTFFLAEPFSPEEDRKRRELSVGNALKDALGDQYSPDKLKIGDKEPKTPAIFCDICRTIQSTAYGVVDISGANANVLIELGMMLTLGKPVFILCREEEEKDLKEQLPSDILWKRAVPYREFIDIQAKLCELISNRPEIEPEPSRAEETRRIIEEIAPPLLQEWERRFEELKRSQEEGLKKLEELAKKARLDEAISREREEVIPPPLKDEIEKVLEQVEQREKFLGFPDSSEVALFRGHLHYHKGEFDKARELYDWAIALDPKSRVAWYNKAVASERLERHEEAISCYDKLIELEPGDPLAWHMKGSALEKLERYQEAVWCYDKSIELWPDDPDGWDVKGLALRKLKRYEEAIACFDKAIELEPNYVDAWFHKGGTLGELGNWEEARKCHAEALRIDLEYVPPSQKLVEACLILGDFDEGLKIAEKAMALVEEARDICISRFLLILALFLGGNEERAQIQLDRLVDYLRGLEEGFKVTEWDFSPLLPTIENKLEARDKQKVLSLIALLKGEIGLEEFMRRYFSW